MRTADFDYELPEELIAQQPANDREASRLLVMERPSTLTHQRFSDIPNFLRADDIIVLNDSKVIPARARGIKLNGGGHVEILLTEEIAQNDWWVMLRPGKRIRPGTVIRFTNKSGQPTEIEAIVQTKTEEGLCRLRFQGTSDLMSDLDQIGEVPLPPYIHREPRELQESDRQRYQTVFARKPGSVAAPTAGLHFSQALLRRLKDKGVTVCALTLHVGLGTFAPVKTDDLTDHLMHEERYELSPETAGEINRAKQRGGRVFAVGTTTLRVMETIAAEHGGRVTAANGRTRIFIHPPYGFRAVDALVTNFHLPRSTLLMLVSAFAAPGQTTGRDTLLGAYAEAIAERYRFFSYGDAMLVL